MRELIEAQPSGVQGRRRGWVRRGVVVLVRAYQAGLSPVLGPACRFEPSCSEYTIEAVDRHGALRGLALGLRRIARCHPFGGMGYDPVPEVERRGP